MNIKIAALGALLAGSAFGAQASTSFYFDLSGQGYGGNGVITIAPDVSPTDPNPLCGTSGQNPCRSDPVEAFMVTGITGTFSDAPDGIASSAITGLIPISPTDERSPNFDPSVPSSLSFLDVTPFDPTSGLSYDNLLFPNGSPLDCGLEFPFGGTYLDVFGVAFTIAGGDKVVIWGDGNAFGPLTYGAGVITPGGQLLNNYAFSGVSFVPEPTTWALMLAGFGALGLALRRGRRQGKQAA